MTTHAMRTGELVRHLIEADPAGEREVYIIAWFGDGEPLADKPLNVYVDDEDDVVISGLLQHARRPATDATKLTPFHVVMLVLATALLLVLLAGFVQ